MNPPAPLWGHQAVRKSFSKEHILQSFYGALQHSLQFFQACKFSGCRSHILQLPAIWLLVAIAPTDRPFYPHLAWNSGFWCQPARPWNSMKFQAILNTLRNHQNSAWRPPKTSKMRSPGPKIALTLAMFRSSPASSRM